jgi:hypothetical protein
LCYVGEPFEYDVFVSYAHAENETGASLLRDWSKQVAGRLRDRLATALPTTDPASAVHVFLDDRVLRSGDPLTETLREKVKRSALLLVLISPLYTQKSWCLDELEWFFEQADRDGRSQRHCTVLRIQPVPDTSWPKRLRDERGRPVVFRDFADPAANLPLGLEDSESHALKDAIRQAHIELLGKLKELAGQLAARRVYQQAAVPPVHPVLYLQARREELPQWQATRAELNQCAIVNPESLPEPVADDALLQQLREKRLEEYAECDGLALLRTGADDTLRLEVMAAYKDRQRVYQQRRRNIPWAIVDRVGNAPPVFSAYKVPCIPATAPGWPDQLIRTLGLEPAHGAG